MSKAGQNTFKGINTQAKASLLLFLMNLKNQDFNSITLEDENWEDFTLNFKSGKRIICESKDRKKTLSWSEIKSIISSIEKKHSIQEADEVLIVLRTVDSQLESNIQYLKYDLPETKNLYKSHKYTDAQIEILKRTKFFKIESDEFLYQEASTYFSDQILYWVPQDDLEMFMDSVLVHGIYEKSQAGSEFTKNELVDAIENYKRRKIKDSYAYDPERKSLEEQLRVQLTGANDSSSRDRILNSRALTAITAQPNLGFFLLDYIKSIEDLSLSEFDELWKATLKRLYLFTTLLIFEKQIDDFENAKYILKFVSENYDSFESPVRDNFNQEFATELVTKIYDQFPQLLNSVMPFIEKILSLRKDEYTKLENRRDISRERDFVSQLLYKVFVDFKKKDDSKMMDKIVKIAYEYFDLVSDDSRHNLFTPNEIFSIIREYLEINFKDNLDSFIKEIIKQYQRREWYKNYSGWELSGGGISQSGNEFSITDRHFVSLVLVPAFKAYYHSANDEAWSFINSRIARTIKQISRKKPDFINRSAIPVIFNEFRNGNHNEEAFAILADFIKMRKGIPWKADLIYQELKNDYSEEQKWRLIEVGLENYNDLPVNVFSEQIVSNLASDAKNKVIQQKAINTIKRWAKNPEYEKRRLIESFNLVDHISSLLKEETFDDAVLIFQELITSKDFIEKEDSWRTWDIARILATILSKNPTLGIKILERINLSKKLSLNQQTLICSSINDIEKGNKELLLKVYQDFVFPMLEKLDGNIVKVEKRISNRYAREQIVQYAEKLADSHCFEEALFIVNIFINDSDPILTSYDSDKKGDFNYHQKIIEGDDNPTINTVRGYCAWVLQKFATLYGRNYIPEILTPVEKLTKDLNYYVRVQACVPLLELTKNRNTVLPENSKERFLSVEVAERIEQIAFNMLEDVENHKLPAVMKHLAMVFTYMRSVKQDKAMRILEIFLKNDYPDKTKQRGHDSFLADVLSDAASLYIFFAEFRTKSFKDWPKDWPELGEFNDQPFKKLLRSLLGNKNSEIRHIFSWQIARLPEEVKNSPEFENVVKMSVGYLVLATKIYDHDTFENIYRFIEDYIEDQRFFELCFNLWSKCILTESHFFKKTYTKEKLQDMYWWPFFYNGKILVSIANKKGNEEFLKWLKVLVDYPTDLLLANDLDIAVEHLTTFKTNEETVEYIFNRLMERNSKYYMYKQQWKNS